MSNEPEEENTGSTITGLGISGLVFGTIFLAAANLPKDGGTQPAPISEETANIMHVCDALSANPPQVSDEAIVILKGPSGPNCDEFTPG